MRKIYYTSTYQRKAGADTSILEKYKGRKEITENQDYILYHIYLYQQHVADPVLFSYFLS